MSEFSLNSWKIQNEKDSVWLPKMSDYNPGIKVSDWIKYLKDNELFDTDSLCLIYQFYKMERPATCTDLAEEYGGVREHYINAASQLGKQIAEKNNCPLPNMKDAKYWPILLQGRKKKGHNGVYEYRIRPELAEAIEQSPELFKPFTEHEDLPEFSLNTIFYGPPGTGKTYNTAHRAVEIITGKDLDDPFEEYNRLCASGRICFVTFHQSYSYEEFIEGIRPVPPEDHSEGLSYEVRDGVFKRFCNSARNSWSDKPPKMNDDPQVWKVSLKGTGDNPIRTDCLNNGHIRIGWHEYGDDVTDETDYSAHGGKIVLNSFINRMKIGDLVLSCYSENTVDAIGVVTGDYRYDKSGGDYPRFRDVEWIRKFDDPVDIRKINNGKTMTLASVYKLNVLVPDVLALAGYDQSGADDKRYVIIIDEINRGNIARIFGELITLLEPSKREGNKEGLSAILPYSGDTFSVPKNVYIIGTMNTADKSLVSLDAALRRRFVFEEMMPNYNLLSDDVEGVDLQELLKAINERIEVLYDRDHVIGHSYLMKVDSLEALNSAFKDSIIPLLQEYFLDDFEKIGQVLSLSGKASESAFVSEKKYHQQFQNIPKHKYTMNEGPFDKEDFISLYPQTPE